LMLDRNRRDTFKLELTMMPQYSIEAYTKEHAEKWGRANDLVVNLMPADALPIHDEYFKKILTEIIDNACKFSDAGTPIHVKSVVSDNMYEITITDHGRGMKEEDIKRIGAFMQFERKTYEQQGSGLGLITALRLTELHGGKLIVQSSQSPQNHKTEIIIKLPICNLDGKPLVSLPNTTYNG
jgi:two-component system sensor histidine kinase/response regulator